MDEGRGSPTGLEAKKRRLEAEAICAENPQFQFQFPFPDTRKVGMVTHSMNYEMNEYEVKLYVVDLKPASDSDSASCEYALAVPTVRFVLPVRDTLFAVCVLNSTVYMFGGFNPYPKKPRPKEKYARKFELLDEDLEVLANGSGDSCRQVKEVKELTEITLMNHAKAVPIAIPMPDGKKILVFGGNVLEKHGFEVYDPLENSWEDLPELPPFYYRPNHIHTSELPFTCRCGQVKSYSFIDPSHFYLHTGIEDYVLNLSDKKWSIVGVPKIQSYWRGLGYFVTVERCYAIVCRGMAYYLPDGGFLSQTYRRARYFVPGPKFQLSTFPKDQEEEEEEEEEGVWRWVEFTCPQGILPLEPPINEEVAKVAWTCILKLQRPCPVTRRGDVRTLIDICRTELELTPPDYFYACDTHPEGLTPMKTTVFKSVRLRIPIFGCLHSLDLISL